MTLAPGSWQCYNTHKRREGWEVGVAMQDETRFGRLILYSKPKLAEPFVVLLLRTAFIIPFLYLLVDAIGATVTGDTTLPFGVGVLSSLFLFALFCLFAYCMWHDSKKLEAAIYENGYIIRDGKRIMETAFSEVMGIKGGITIVRSNTGIKGQSGRVSDSQKFYDELEVAFANYQLRGITRETLHHANIWFGDHLELRGGSFIYRGKDKGEIVIPPQAVHHIEFPRRPTKKRVPQLTGPRGEDGKGEVLADLPLIETINIVTLFYLVQMISESIAKDETALREHIRHLKHKTRWRYHW